jgi:hypothetical protein
MTTQRTPSAAPPTLGRWRRVVIWTLIVLASVIALVSTLTLWVDRQMFDNNSWRKASEDVITNPEIRNSLSIYLVNQLYDNVDVAAAIQNRLPEGAKSIAPTLAGALRQPATNAVNQLLARPRVVNFFVNASATAHEKLVNVLENKTGNGISTGDGVVTLDLSELVTQIGTELGVPDAALAKIPPDTGVITVLRSDQLSAAQTAVKGVKVLSTGLLVLVLALYALAIYLARGERRQTLRNVGFAFVLVGLTVLVVRRVAGNVAVDALTQPQGEAAGRQAWLIGSEILTQIGWATILYGAFVVAGSIFAGPTAAATSARGRVAPVLNERPGIAWAGVGVVFLLLVLWGGTHALRTWWGILLLGALIAIGVVALRHQTKREFPGREADAAGAVAPA